MKKIKMGYLALLGALVTMLGFSSCNKTRENLINKNDSPNTSGKIRPEDQHLRLMYGLRPTDYEQMEAPTPQKDTPTPVK